MTIYSDNFLSALDTMTWGYVQTCCYWSSAASSQSLVLTRLYNLVLGAGIAQLEVCWIHCPAWCNIVSLTLLWVSGREDFSLGVNMGSDSIPQNSFGWECRPRFSLCTHAFRHMDSYDPDVHALDRWMLATKAHPACTIHEDGMWLPLWLDYKTVTYAKNLTPKKYGEPQRYSWECRRRRRSTILF